MRYLLPLLLVLMAGSWNQSIVAPSKALIFDWNTGYCSSVCEATECNLPPFLRYGKYCGVGYTGCPGQSPCDALDACCQAHDACIGNNVANYLNVECNRDLLHCVRAFRESGHPGFPTNNTCTVTQVVSSIDLAMRIALDIGA